MARTVRTKVYKFSELSETAKQKAIDDYRNEGVDTSHYWEEAHESVKAFHDVFGTSEGNRSWLDVRFDDIDGNALELKGLRLRTYIINNFWGQIFTGKYYSTKGEYINGKYTYKFRHSKCQFESSCPFTGVYYDDILLQPILEFVNWKLRPDYNSYMDFETLINDCFDNLRKALESEDEYRNSDEAIAEEIESNDYEFTADGRLF